MLLNVDIDVQVAGAAAVAANLALAVQAHLHAALDAGGDGDGDLAGLAFLAPAAAMGAGGLDDRPPSLATGAGDHLGELAEDAALGPAHLAVALAGSAGVQGGARLVAGAGADTAVLQAGEFNLTLGAEDGFFEAEDDPVLQVAAPLRLTAAAAGPVSEEGIEDVSEPAETVEAVEGLVGPPVGAHAGFAVAVVLRPFLGIGEDLVGLVYLFELVLGAGALIAVGVELHGLLAEGLADVLFPGADADA